MGNKQDSYRTELQKLLPEALAKRENKELENYLTGNSGLPGPRGNLELIEAFAGVVAELVTQPEPPVEALETLLDGWAALPLNAAPVNDPHEILPAVAVRTYGQVAKARPDWWEDEINKLRRASNDRRWRTREMAAAGLQSMLEANWERAVAELENWITSGNPLEIRAAVAGVAEPRLLKAAGHGEKALEIQAEAMEWLAKSSPEQRRSEDFKTFRQALGYTVSVAVAASPEPGIALLEKLAKSPDKDVQWVVRENLKKNRLRPILGRLTPFLG